MGNENVADGLGMSVRLKIMRRCELEIGFSEADLEVVLNADNNQVVCGNKTRSAVVKWRKKQLEMRRSRS